MRSVSAALNGFSSHCSGCCSTCGSRLLIAWMLATISRRFSSTSQRRDDADDVFALRRPPSPVPCGVLASALAFVTGLFLLLMQVPRRPANSPLRLSGSDGDLAATLSPDVLSQALSERVQDLPGVERCTVFVTGSPSKLWVQADTSVAPDCEVEWIVTELRKLLNEDVATSLGTPPKQLDVLVRLARSVSSTSVSKAVTGQPSPAITGTGTGA